MYGVGQAIIGKRIKGLTAWLGAGQTSPAVLFAKVTTNGILPSIEYDRIS